MRSCAPVSTGRNADVLRRADGAVVGRLLVGRGALRLRDARRRTGGSATQDSPGDSGAGEVATLVQPGAVPRRPRCRRGRLVRLRDAAGDLGLAGPDPRQHVRHRSGVGVAVVEPRRGRHLATAATSPSTGCSPAATGATRCTSPPRWRTPNGWRRRSAGCIGDLIDQVAMRYAHTGQAARSAAAAGAGRDRQHPAARAARAGLDAVGARRADRHRLAVDRPDHKPPTASQAGTVIANHRTKVFFSGITDGVTGDLAAKLLGDEQVMSRQVVQRARPFDSGRRSLQESLCHHRARPRPRAARAAHRVGAVDPRHDPAGPSHRPVAVLRSAAASARLDACTALQRSPSPSPAGCPILCASARRRGRCRRWWGEAPAVDPPSRAAPKLRVITGD